MVFTAQLPMMKLSISNALIKINFRQFVFNECTLLYQYQNKLDYYVLSNVKIIMT